MCRSLVSELSTSFAAFVSLNVSAAVQLFPMIGANEERWLIIDSRNDLTSKITKAAQASSRATLDVAMMMTICFCRMESLLSIETPLIFPFCSCLYSALDRRRGQILPSHGPNSSLNTAEPAPMPSAPKPILFSKRRANYCDYTGVLPGKSLQIRNLHTERLSSECSELRLQRLDDRPFDRLSSEGSACGLMLSGS